MEMRLVEQRQLGTIEWVYGDSIDFTRLPSRNARRRNFSTATSLATAELGYTRSTRASASRQIFLNTRPHSRITHLIRFDPLLFKEAQLGAVGYRHLLGCLAAHKAFENAAEESLKTSVIVIDHDYSSPVSA